MKVNMAPTVVCTMLLALLIGGAASRPARHFAMAVKSLSFWHRGLVVGNQQCRQSDIGGRDYGR